MTFKQIFPKASNRYPAPLQANNCCATQKTKKSSNYWWFSDKTLYLCTMFKEYRLTIFAVVVFAVIIIFGIKGLYSKAIVSSTPMAQGQRAREILYQLGRVFRFSFLQQVVAVLFHQILQQPVGFSFGNSFCRSRLKTNFIPTFLGKGTSLLYSNIAA